MIDGGAEHCQKAVPDLSSEIKAKYDQWNRDNAALLQRFREDPEYDETRRMVIDQESSLPPSQQLEECRKLLEMMTLETGKKLEEDLKPEEPLPTRGKPESAFDFRMSGYKHLDAGRTKEAIGDFTRAIELDPRDAGGYFARGKAYLQDNQLKKAVGDLSKCIEIEARDVSRVRGCYSLRAQAYYQSGNFDAAIGDVNLVLAGSWDLANRVESLYVRGKAYKGKRNYEQAISDFTEVLAIGRGEKRVESLQARAELYLLKKDYDKAWGDVQEAEKLGHPLSPEFLQKLRKASGRDH